jgi:Flp pilus assembly CpaF family ATPase
MSLRKNKYNAKKTNVDGITFDSRREANRYGELKTLLKSGLISDLELQVPFPCVINSKKICSYKADFVYTQDGKRIIEDVKGFMTRDFKLKKKLVEALHNIEITLVK